MPKRERSYRCVTKTDLIKFVRAKSAKEAKKKTGAVVCETARKRRREK